MLDLKRIREETEAVQNALLKRMDSVDLAALVEQDAERRRCIAENENLKARKNEASKQIPRMKKAGEDVAPIMAEMKEISQRTTELNVRQKELEDAIQNALARLPNLPDDDVPAGGKENNEVIRGWGEKPAFDFEPRDHVTLVEALKLIDYKRGVKIGGNGFWLYRGEGALLEWALLNYFVETHSREGYTFMLPPHILTYACGYTAGQFPKFREDIFEIANDAQDENGMQFLLPTAETALINLHREEILDETELPLKYFAYTPCYRKEAGSYRTSERGMIRGHQFNKIEMFQYTKPEDSSAALEELIARAEKLVQGLGLHYQVSRLAARDCSASMAKTYDIEVWIPSMNEYKEVSSASNARDYQARRGMIRFKRQGAKKPEFVHTLNASGLATSRLLPAIVEQFQHADGSVSVPEALRKWVGKDRLAGE